MDITNTSKSIKSTKLINGETINYSLFYGIAFIVFLVIKQVIKNVIGLTAGIALPIAFCIAMLGLFFCEKKFVFSDSIRAKAPKQILGYIFRCLVDFGFYKIFEFTLVELLNLSYILPYLFTLIVGFVFNYYFDKLIVFDVVTNPANKNDNKIYKAFYSNRYVIASMGLGLIGILFVFMLFKLFPFGDKTVLRMDLYHQYGPLFVEFYDRVMHHKSFIYSWTSGGGSSFLGNYFNYLSSPLSILIFLFDRNQIGYAISTLVIVKGVLAAGTFTYFLKKSFDRHSFASASFGVFYGFCGYFLAYYWNIMWIDGMILLPIIALGIENIINKGKCSLYIASLAILLYSSYYMGYMACIFSVLYFFVYYFAYKDITDTVKDFEEKPKAIKGFFNNKFINSGFKFAISSLIVGGITACILVPVFFILQSCSATSDGFPSVLESNFNLIDMISSHLIGLETTIRSSGEDVLPNISCGIFAVILVPLYLINKEIRLKEKVAYILMLLFMVTSFDCNYLDFLWHAMHLPNDLPFRYSYIYVFIMLIIAFRGLMHIKAIEYKDIMVTGMGIILMILLYQKFPTNKINEFSIYVSIVFTLVWTVVLLTIKKGNLSKFVIGITIACMTFCEVIVADSNSYVFTQSQTPYVDKMETMANAVGYLKDNDKTLFRAELTDLDTRMDPCLYDYNGMSVFSSMAYEKYSGTQYSLGLFGNRINSYTYNTQTPVYNMMYGLKYLIKDRASLDPSDNYYSRIFTTKDKEKTKVYENKYYLPLAFVTSSEIDNWDTTEGDPFDVQGDLLESACGASDVFVPVEYVGTETFAVDCEDVTENGTWFVDNISEYGGGSIDITLKAINDSNMYVYITSSEIENVNYYWNDSDSDTAYQNINEPYIMDLGAHSKDEEVRVSIDLNGVDSTSASFSIYAYNIDEDVLNAAYDILSLGQLKETKHTDTSIEGTINAGFDGYLYTSIPYDEGWTVYIDGQRVNTFEIGESQLGSTIKHGEHTVKLKYQPKGQKIGAIITILTWVALGGLYLIKRMNLTSRLARKKNQGEI